MSSTLVGISPSLAIDKWQAILSLPQYGTLDDLAAMAVLATLSVVYLLRGVLWNRPDAHLYKMYERPQEHLANLSASQSTRDIAQKLEQIGADIVIFWGSQSGTAEKLAKRFCKEIRQRFGKTVLAADMSDFDPATIANLPESKLAIFMVSTYGEGEPSDNLGEFWSWIGATSNKSLSKLTFAAFGLGNSNYRYYNAVVDHVATRLQTLGAHPFLKTGKADDSRGETEEHYLQWKAALFAELQNSRGFEEHEPVYEPAVEVNEYGNDISSAVYSGKPWISSKSQTNRSVSPTHSLPIRAARELFQDVQDRNCIHMEIDLSEQPGLKYKTGDHLGIWPINPRTEVDRLLNCLGKEVGRDCTLKIIEIDQNTKSKVPEYTTLKALLTHYLEICAPLSREEIGSLVQFAPTNGSKELLTRLSKDKSEYETLLNTKYINFGRILELVAPGLGSWNHIPLSFIVETLPAMRPRYYSISSSSVVQPRKVAITAVVADRLLSAEQRVPGLCTNYLRGHKASLDEGDLAQSSKPIQLLAHVRKSTFKLPALSSHPIVMVAAGTGIAPFRAFLYERARLLKMGRPIGQMMLVFGCRSEEKDFLYYEELQELMAVFGSKLTLLTAFSRPQSGEKMYVQHRIAKHSEELVNMLVDYDANFYICGSAAMARDISRAVGAALGDRQDWSEEEVQRFMEKQKKTKRWHQDVWG